MDEKSIYEIPTRRWSEGHPRSGPRKTPDPRRDASCSRPGALRAARAILDGRSSIHSSPRGTGRRLRLALLCILALGWACAPGSLGPQPPELEGTWRAFMEHAGQPGELVVRFDRGATGDLTATLSLPTIDAWEVATLPVDVHGDRIELGLLTLTRRPDGGLSGVLPDALVPVYDIAFTLRRTRPLARPRPRTPDAPRVEPVWTTDLGSPIWAGIAFEGATVFVGADDGVVRALDARTGRNRWSFATDGAIRARPTPTGDALLVHSDDGFLYSLDRATGTARWRTKIEEAPVERVPPGASGSRYDHYGSSAVRAGDTVYVGSHEGGLHALDAGTGEELWRHGVGDGVSSTPAVEGGRVFFGSYDGNVYAVDAGTGEELWRHETGGAVPSSPAVAGGLVVVGSRSYDLLGLDATSGHPVWSHYFWYSWVDSSARIADGTAYVGSSDAQALSALDAATGELEWRFDLGGSGWGRPAVTRDAVYLGVVGVADYLVDHRGGFFAVDRADGEPLWQYPVERPGDAHVWGFAASPATGDGLVFAGGLSGRVAAFSPLVAE